MINESDINVEVKVMSERRPNRESKVESHHQAFIERQNQCPLCGSQLDIKVESYLENFTLREEAHCPDCAVLARVKDHKMH